ncbi:hypothetical protein PROFUN_14284 [Planoprotostelium fungivorum]|uniref:Uncharacterized protein n=1 Tax=Planoprotostelium fungivorum TaxID=1890364 RepID=A0A2P6N0F4_9EUKA|nr:hypothetical protein PROFUN_14284 [Planoprotostelium fungivorum]
MDPLNWQALILKYRNTLSTIIQLSSVMPPLITDKPLLGPLICLSSWTFIMEALLYKRRIPAISQYGVTLDDPATAKEQLEEKLPPFVQWAADNYNHLLEQPTQFYAAMLALSMMDVKDKTTVGLAWSYVGLRLFHSVVHVSTNNLHLRFPAFVASSIVLASITAKAAWVLIKTN